MAAPSYTTDLSGQVISECENNTNFTNIGTGADATETDYFVQGGACVSKPFNINEGGIYFDYLSNISFGSGDCFWMWYYFGCPNSVEIFANGGMRALIGSTAGNYNTWTVKGSDSYVYGGWVCIPVDPEVTPDTTVGSPTGNKRIFGWYCKLKTGKAVSKGNPFGMDAMRYGRGELRIVGGDSDGYATFAGAATTNDDQSNRWGLIQAIDGGYLQQGLFIFGYGGVVDFRDANKSVLINHIAKVTAGFNTFEVRNASSRVDLTAMSFLSLGTTSRGRWITTDNATINIINCVFTDMATFSFLSNSTIKGTVFRRCDAVTQGGAAFDECQFENSYADVSLIASNPSVITDCEFTSDGSNHAIQVPTLGSDAEFTLLGCTYNNYDSEDGSTGNEAFCNNSGRHIDLTILGGDTPSVRNIGASTTTIIIPEVTLTIKAPVSLVGAEIRIYDMDETLPYLGTELSGTESHDATTYSYGGSAGNVIWIQIMKDGYKEFGQEYTIPEVNTEFMALLIKETNN